MPYDTCFPILVLSVSIALRGSGGGVFSFFFLSFSVISSFAANDVYQLCMCVTREIVCKKKERVLYLEASY